MTVDNMTLMYYRLFRGGALDSQVTDSQFVNGLLGNGQNALFIKSRVLTNASTT